MQPILPKAKILILVFSLLIIVAPFVLIFSTQKTLAGTACAPFVDEIGSCNHGDISGTCAPGQKCCGTVCCAGDCNTDSAGSATGSASYTYSNCYIFETGIPFFAKKGECKSLAGLQNVPNVLIKALFPIAGVLAFIMIIWAGFEYAASGGNTNKQKTAQARIVNALIGLFLLFAFWIILYTINPDILNPQNLSFDSIIMPPVYTYIPTIASSNLINLAKSFATRQKVSLADYNTDPASTLDQYLQLRDYLGILKDRFGDPDPAHGASCDTYVALVMRMTIDPEYPKISVSKQYGYLLQKEKTGNVFCFTYTTLEDERLKSGAILFTHVDENDPRNLNKGSFEGDLSHTALKLDDGPEDCYYQASTGKDAYFPYGPSHSWYTKGIACRYIPAQTGGGGGYGTEVGF